MKMFARFPLLESFLNSNFSLQEMVNNLQFNSLSVLERSNRMKTVGFFEVKSHCLCVICSVSLHILTAETMY